MADPDHVRIPDARPRNKHTADGYQTTFRFTFPLMDETHLAVYLNETRQPSGFDVIGERETDGGVVFFSQAPAAGAIVTLVREVPIERLTDFQENIPIQTKVLNDEFDVFTTALQDVAERVRRSIGLKSTDTDADLQLPSKDERANKLIGFDANGNAIATTVSVGGANGAENSASDVINDSAAPGATVAESLEALEDDLKVVKIAAARAIVAAENDDPQISLELPDAMKRRDFLLGFTSSGAVTTTAVATVASMDALAAQGLSGIATVAGMNALRGRASAPDEVVFLQGYYAAADGGDGFFAWDANSTEPDDGGIIIAPNHANPGRWRRCALGEAINVQWFGAKLDGVTDDTAAIQAAIDTRLAPVFIPAAPRKSSGIIVSQLQIHPGTKLFGAGPGTIYNVGTRLKQKSGCNLSMIVPHSSIATWQYMHGAQICDMQLEGDWERGGGSSTAGCGIELTRRTGENFLIQNVHVRRFAESGIRLNRGSTPGGIFNCASFWNGEYGFDLQHAPGDVWHQFAVRSVSGDSNGVALIRVKTYGGHVDSLYIDGVKAETKDDLTKQQDVIILENTNHCPINISNVAQYSAISTRSIVRIVGTGARVIARNFRASHTCENWFSDASDTKNVREMPKEASQSSAVLDGVWASHLPDPSVNIRTSADF